MAESQSRIPENADRYARLFEAAKRVKSREDRDSGLRNRDQITEPPTKEKIQPPDPEDISDESKELADALEVRVTRLFETYKSMPGVQYKDDTNEYLIARLDPSTRDYVFGHLKGLDGLLARATFEPRLLPNVQKAIEVWEALQGEIPADFVDDGLEVDGQALLNLRDFVSYVQLTGNDSSFRSKAEHIIRDLEKRMPTLMSKIKEEGIN